MNEKNTKDWKSKIWTLPCIGLILILISFLAPSIFSSFIIVSEYWWMWGLFSATQFSQTQVDFYFYAYELFIPGIICFILLVICFFIGIHYTNKVKQNYSKQGSSLIAFGSAFIIIVILYAILMTIGFPIYINRSLGYTGLNLWSFYKPNFGMIGPILGGVLMIIGGLLSKYSTEIDKSLKEKNISIVAKKNLSNTVLEKPDNIVKNEKTVAPPPYNFCEECGAKLEGIYCHNCGNKT